MARYPRLDNGRNKTLIKRGTWTVQEDQKLIDFIERHGIWNWNQMAKLAGLARTGKSCRLRWMNYLRPNIRHGNFTKEEEEIIINLHRVLGNRWAVIATKLRGRTDNDVKNYWNTRLKKCLLNKKLQKSTTTCDVKDMTIKSDPVNEDNPKAPSHVPPNNESLKLANVNTDDFHSYIHAVHSETLAERGNKGDQQGLLNHVLEDLKHLCIVHDYYQSPWCMDQLGLRTVPCYECMPPSEPEYNHTDSYEDFGMDLWGS